MHYPRSDRSTPVFRSALRAGCVLSAVLTLVACGYKGPLYMPPPPPAPDASLTTPPETSPGTRPGDSRAAHTEASPDTRPD